MMMMMMMMIRMQWKFKDRLTGLGRFFGKWKLFKIDDKSFLFYLKSPFRFSRYLKFRHHILAM